MKFQECVSIITPTYNAQEYIQETITSIINQSYTNWELLITDDCSTDKTTQIIKEFIKKDKRIKLFMLSENSGAGVARNNSIKQAKGRYISFCDSDDQWKYNKLESQIKFMKSNCLSFTFCSYDIIDKSGNYLRRINAPPSINYSMLLKNNYIGCLTAIYDTNSLGKIYMSKLRKRQDWALWLKIFKKINSSLGQSESLAIYRFRSDSISKNKIEMFKYNWQIYSKELGFSFIKSLYFITRFLYYYARKKFFN